MISLIDWIPEFIHNLSKQKLISRSYRNIELMVYVVTVFIWFSNLKKSRSNS